MIFNPKRRSVVLTVMSVLALALTLGAPARPAAASGDYYYDFEAASEVWAAGGDSWISGETSTIKSDDNYCPESGTHYDNLTWVYSSYATAAVWLVKSFPGDGSDTVTVSWAIRDESSFCSTTISCITGYYIGTSAPTAQTQFTTVNGPITNQDWHTYDNSSYSAGTSGNTIYVAFMWRPQFGYDNKPLAMGFDCLDVNIQANNGP